MDSNENLAPQVIQRLMKEIKGLSKNPPEGIKVSFSEDNLSNIFADIQGPEDTPFEQGVFRVKIAFGPDFPQAPPKGFFLTKIFHPNVSESGEICVNTLKKDWKPVHGLEHILMIIRCLLIFPNPESALNPEAGRMLLDAYEDYFKRAQMLTKLYAQPKAESKQADEEDEDSKQAPIKKQKAAPKKTKSKAVKPSLTKKVTMQRL